MASTFVLLSNLAFNMVSTVLCIWPGAGNDFSGICMASGIVIGFVSLALS